MASSSGFHSLGLRTRCLLLMLKQAQQRSQDVFVRILSRIEDLNHPRNRWKHAILDERAAFLFRCVHVSKQEADVIGQFEAERDSAGLHSPLQLRQEETPPAVVAKQVISEIGRAIGTQIEGVGVGLLELAETSSGNRVLKVRDMRVRVGELRHKFGHAIADGFPDRALRITQNFSEQRIERHVL